MRLLALLACTHAFVNTPSSRRPTRLRAAPAQDTVRLQKKIAAFEAEVKLKQTLVTKLEADLAAAREAARVAEEELRRAKQELAGVVPMNKKSRRDEVPINAKTSRAPNVDALVQEKRAQIDQAAAEKRLRDEEAAERRFRESAERRRELEKARSERQVSQAKKMLARDEEKQLYGETLYDLLGVTRDASAADVKQGYRKAAASCPPDTNSSNPEKYSRIMDAYDVRFCVRIRHRRDDVSCSRAGAQGRREEEKIRRRARPRQGHRGHLHVRRVRRRQRVVHQQPKRGR